MSIRRLIELSTILLLLSVVYGLWTTPNLQAGTIRFLLLLVSLIGFLLIKSGGYTTLVGMSTFMAVIGSAVSVAYLIRFVFVGFLGGSAFWFHVPGTPQNMPFEVHVPAGLIVVTMPFLVGKWLDCKGRHWDQRSRIWLILIVLAWMAVLISGSLASVLTLSVASGVVLIWTGWHRTARGSGRSVWLYIGGGLVSAATVVGLMKLSGRWPQVWQAAEQLIEGRWELIEQSGKLVADFSLFGGGLGSIPGLYAHYIRGLPVYFVPHAHNLYVNIGIELGVISLGLFVFICLASLMLLIKAWRVTQIRTSSPKTTLEETMIGLLLFLALGLVDDPIYASLGLPLLLVLPGMALSLSAPGSWSKGPQVADVYVSNPALLALTVLAAISVSFNWSSLAAVYHSNVGAVYMAKVELRDWPSGEWSDGRHGTQLEAAEQHFRRAREFDPENRTALHRLGLIAMERREFHRAAVFLSDAHQLDPDHRGIRKALGYSLTWSQDHLRAEEVLIGIPEASRELRIYQGWWRRRGRSDLAYQCGRVLALLHTP